MQETNAGHEATLTGDQSSGILNSLVQADRLATIPEECDHLPGGAEVQVILLDQGECRHAGYPAYTPHQQPNSFDFWRYEA
jgi:hypothetical protein